MSQVIALQSWSWSKVEAVLCNTLSHSMQRLFGEPFPTQVSGNDDYIKVQRAYFNLQSKNNQVFHLLALLNQGFALELFV